MRKLGRRAGRADGREVGLSLVELAVTMMIMGVVFAATATLVIGAQRTNAQTIARLDQIESARTGVERMSKTLRASVMPSQMLSTCAGCVEDAFIRGEGYDVQFYSNINNPDNSVGPSRVTYTVVATGAGVGNLVQTIQTPNSPIPIATGYQYCNPVVDLSPTCQSHVKEMVAARDVRTDTGSPIFTYYDGSGAELVPSAGALTAAQLASVLSIELRLTVQMQVSVEAQPTTYIQRIMLPNAQAVIRQGEEETP
jgi:type II secretory pathway pseudopilin PulG